MPGVDGCSAVLDANRRAPCDDVGNPCRPAPVKGPHEPATADARNRLAAARAGHVAHRRHGQADGHHRRRRGRHPARHVARSAAQVVAANTGMGVAKYYDQEGSGWGQPREGRTLTVDLGGVRELCAVGPAADGGAAALATASSEMAD